MRAVSGWQAAADALEEAQAIVRPCLTCGHSKGAHGYPQHRDRADWRFRSGPDCPCGCPRYRRQRKINFPWRRT